MNISLDSVTKVFGRLTALDGISAVFEQGRICVLVGPNGAGKTTLLRIIAGLLPAGSGSVTFGDRSPTLGVMMQETFLYQDLTSRENLRLYAGLCGLSHSRVDKLSALLGLEDFMDHDVATLSHGQRQRVSLARALLPEPDILVADEPFLGLDTLSIGRVQKILQGMRSEGKIVLVATHELDIVRGLADDLLFLEAGKIKYFGPFNA